MALKVSKVTLDYGGKPVVEEIDFHVEKGDMVTIIGANGSGKSTILKALCRNLIPQNGIVYLDGKSIHKTDTRELAKKLAVLPQSPRVPDDFTVRDLISYGRFPHLGWTGRLQKNDFAVVDWAIEVTKMGALQHRVVSTLSGGERQRAWIAMALAQQPAFLLLDEPTTFLDICYQFEVLELIKKLNMELNLTIVMVLHDLNQAARYSNHLIALKDGKVYRKGTPREVITKTVLEDVFHIKVKIFNDHEHHCPYFIPVSSSLADKFEATENVGREHCV